MSRKRSSERAGHNAKGSPRYLVLASFGVKPGIKGEKRKRGKRDVKSKKDIQMDAAEIIEETLHNRLSTHRRC